MNIVNLVISFCDHCVILCNICAKCLGFFFLLLLKGNLPECICLSERLLDYTLVQRLNLYFTLHQIILVTLFLRLTFLDFLTMFLVTCSLKAVWKQCYIYFGVCKAV